MTKKTSTVSKTLNTGSILSSHFKKKRTPQAALARALSINPASVIGYKKATSIQTKTLWKICHILEHNFFMDIAQMLPDSYKTSTNFFEAKDQRIAELEEENKILKAEKAVLLESRR